MKVWVVMAMEDEYLEENIISIYATKALAEEEVALLEANKDEDENTRYQVDEWDVIQ
jgi:hypothetical protein